MRATARARGRARGRARDGEEKKNNSSHIDSKMIIQFVICVPIVFRPSSNSIHMNAHAF